MVNISNKNNQKFVQISFSKVVKQIEYKSKLVEIHIEKDTKDYTSKYSFFDNKSIESHKVYAWRRIIRGLFKTSKGTIINADGNGAYKIIKKTFPNTVLVDGIEAFGLMPQIIHHNITDMIIWNKRRIFLLILIVKSYY